MCMLGMKSTSMKMATTGLLGDLEMDESMEVTSLSFPSRENEETKGDQDDKEEEEETTTRPPWGSSEEEREILKKNKNSSSSSQNSSSLSVVLPPSSPASSVPHSYLFHNPSSSSSPPPVESNQNGRYSQATPCLYHPSGSVSTATTGRHHRGEEEEEEKISSRGFHSDGNEEVRTISLEKTEVKEEIEDGHREKEEGEKEEKDGESVFCSSVLSMREEKDNYVDVMEGNELSHYGTADRQEEKEDYVDDEEKTRREGGGGEEFLVINRTRMEEYEDAPTNSARSREVSSFSSLAHEEEGREETRPHHFASVKGEELPLSAFSRRASPVLQAQGGPPLHSEVYVHPEDDVQEDEETNGEEEEEEGDRAIEGRNEHLEEDEELTRDERVLKNREKKENQDREFVGNVSGAELDSSSSPHHHFRGEHRDSLSSTHDSRRRHSRQVFHSGVTSVSTFSSSFSSSNLSSSYKFVSSEKRTGPEDPPSILSEAVRPYPASGGEAIKTDEEEEERRIREKHEEEEEKKKETSRKNDGHLMESGSSPSSFSSSYSSSYHEESLSSSSSSLLSPSLSPSLSSTSESSSSSSSCSPASAEKEWSECIEMIASMREEDFFIEACKLIRQERFDYLESIRMMKEDHSHLDLLSSPSDAGMMMKMMSIMTAEGGEEGEAAAGAAQGGKLGIDSRHGRVDTLDDPNDQERVEDPLHVEDNPHHTNEANPHPHRYPSSRHVYRCHPKVFLSFYDTRSKLSLFMDLLSSTQSQFFLTTSTSSSSSSSSLSHLLNQSSYSP
ncbi:hypothetical protein CSUI_000617 [Cystoisospora suis]|uniref:Uncharacterized protein n=1 Tax=Cystoisospora suis TaxID=483139 RepID=A0A2C6LET0_9APIC|nr:hypothetical protein CSUI_000617 [Cystoisospora suis]